MFEPMKLAEQSTLRNSTNLSSLAVSHLLQLFQCKFDDLLSHTTALYWVYTIFCSIDASDSCKHQVEFHRRECERKSFRVSKDIIFRSVESLETIFSSNVKLLHLVRDPRGKITVYFFNFSGKINREFELQWRSWNSRKLISFV